MDVQCLFLNGLFVDLCDLLLICLFGSEQQDDESSVEKLQCDSSGFTLYMTSCNTCLCVCAGENSVPARREEGSGEPEERPGQKNQDVRIRIKAGKARTNLLSVC